MNLSHMVNYEALIKDYIYVQAAMVFLISAAAAAAAIIEVAHHGNANSNWFPICQQYNGFCERISGTLIGSFIAVVVFIILIIISAVSISRIHA